ncbi:MULTISPECIES: DUF423 domain-containing protein [Myroides]|uniref:DUF423 domain-containing protein n=1 Tax=Myroides odoratus TaxID=256 RepID=A0A9Q6Z7Y7_MYROD|nr:DUF423 domain-containing protein [Myroides odoratus]EHQ42212.1 protein of unknown function DUF423 [Myroides odoratus DSM 2801]EKB09294.1 hypothetical protein HMPREF9716_00114 [Myroides odoratus CIP 103059]QQT99592.1 DUF423 domain-containing protein [Myroides odoratus]WQD58201.1 DUF423 domain-containing protein [Myroides odoratus]STZ29472.1 Protein of uncharacterised function (DUF423) [Myroides odoratus]
MGRKIIITATLLGALGIILGAFGAHGLKKIVSETAVASYEVGVRYQMYHVFFLLFVGLSSFFTDAVKKRLFILTLIGVTLFSGSIYLLTFNGLPGFNVKFLGPITPIGGVFMILAWVYAAIQTLKMGKSTKI